MSLIETFAVKQKMSLPATPTISGYATVLTMRTSFNDRLKQIRRSKGIKQIEAAEAVGISRSFLSDIENGKKDGSFKTVAALADYYGISLDYIKNGSPTPVLSDPDYVAHDDHERILLKLWRLVNEEERRSLMVLLRAGMKARNDAA